MRWVKELVTLRLFLIIFLCPEQKAVYVFVALAKHFMNEGHKRWHIMQSPLFLLWTLWERTWSLPDSVDVFLFRLGHIFSALFGIKETVSFSFYWPPTEWNVKKQGFKSVTCLPCSKSEKVIAEFTSVTDKLCSQPNSKWPPPN